MAEKKIDGIEYKVEPLNAKDAYELLLEIIRLAGPGAQHLPWILSFVNVEDVEQKLEAESATLAAISAVINTHGVEALVEFRSRILSIAQIKRPSGSYDSVDLELDFRGDLEAADAVYDFVMEEQFGNFSKGDKGHGPVALALILMRNICRLQK